MPSGAISSQGTLLAIESATPGTYTNVGDVHSFQGPGGAAKVIDATNLESVAKEKRMGLPDEGQFSVDIAYAKDTGQAAMRTARLGQTRKLFKVTFRDTSKAEFAGFVLEYSLNGAIDDIVKGKITIEIDGVVTWTDAP
jgi:predicted secreted protein